MDTIVAVVAVSVFVIIINASVYAIRTATNHAVKVNWN